MTTVVPLVSSIVSLVFALFVLDQFLARRRPHQLVWTVGLLMYSASTATEFLAESGNLNDPVYRAWYLIGAVFVAAYLGMGTIYLLAPRRAAHVTMAVLGAASIYATVRVLIVPLDWSALASAAPSLGPTLTGKAFPADVRLITPFFNTFGTVALVGGAIYSAWAFWRGHRKPHRVVSNVLIAAGALLPALGGTLIRFGIPQYFYVLELLGVVLIFLGFLRTREVFGLYRIPFSQGLHRGSG